MATGDQHLELRLWSTEDSEDYSVGFSADGARLAVLGGDQVRIWELSTCQVLSTIEVPGSEAMVVSPRTNAVATGGHNPATGGNVTVWDVSSLTSAPSSMVILKASPPLPFRPMASYWPAADVTASPICGFSVDPAHLQGPERSARGK